MLFCLSGISILVVSVRVCCSCFLVPCRLSGLSLGIFHVVLRQLLTSKLLFPGFAIFFGPFLISSRFCLASSCSVWRYSWFTVFYVSLSWLLSHPRASLIFHLFSCSSVNASSFSGYPCCVRIVFSVFPWGVSRLHLGHSVISFSLAFSFHYCVISLLDIYLSVECLFLLVVGYFLFLGLGSWTMGVFVVPFVSSAGMFFFNISPWLSWCLDRRPFALITITSRLFGENTLLKSGDLKRAPQQDLSQLTGRIIVATRKKRIVSIMSFAGMCVHHGQFTIDVMKKYFNNQHNTTIKDVNFLPSPHFPFPFNSPMLVGLFSSAEAWSSTQYARKLMAMDTYNNQQTQHYSSRSCITISTSYNPPSWLFLYHCFVMSTCRLQLT